MDRYDLIELGLKRKYPKDVMNNFLMSNGEKPLNYIEMQNIREGRPLRTNAGKNAVQDLKDFTAGVNTAGTVISKAIWDKDYRKQLKSNIDNYMYNRTPAQAVNDLVNANINYLNISTNNLGKNPIDTIQRIGAGIYNHPLTAFLDFSPATKLLPKNAVGNTLEKINAPKSIRQFIPSTNIDKVNTAIKTGRGVMSTTASTLNHAFADVVNSADKAQLQQAFRNLSTGEWKGNQATIDLTNRVKKVQEMYNKELVNLGMDVAKEKETAISQMAMEILNPNRTNSNIYTGKIAKAIQGDNSARASLLREGVTKKQLDDIVSKGNEYYDQGLLRPISHRYTFATPKEGLVPAQDYLLGAMANRNVGWATPEQLVYSAPKAYEDLAQSIVRSGSGRVSVDEIARKVGRNVQPNQIPSILESDKNIRIISPNAFSEVMKNDYSLGRFDTMSKRVKQLQEGLSPEDYGKYQDNLYAINKDYLEPLLNAVSESSNNRPLGKLNSNWKFVQLITPKYVTENRIGNSILNTLEGVTPLDYIKTWTKEYNDIAPTRLRTDTSYHGIMGNELAGSRTLEAIRRSFNETKEAFKNKDYSNAFTGFNKTIANTIMPTEAGFEFKDRYANFIRQAERLSETTGEDVKSIIKRAGKDNDLYNQLITPVEQSLGDYTGRNWNIDPQFYNFASTALPFFKYPTQAVRTLFRQARENPIRFQLMAQAPSKIGNEIWKDQVAREGLGENENGGIFINSLPGRFSPSLLQRFDSNPLTAGSDFLYSVINNPSDINVSPLFDLARITQFKDRYGNTASSPKYMNVGQNTFVLNDKGKPTRELFTRPTTTDVSEQALSTFANLYLSPVIAWNRYLGPIASNVTNQTWYPNYDTTVLGQVGDKYRQNPIYSGRINSRGRKGFEAFVGPTFGNRFIQVYPTYNRALPRDVRSSRKKIIRQRILKQL